MPDHEDCGICHTCSFTDFASLETGRKSVRGKKAISIGAGPNSGNYCIRHGIEVLEKIKQEVDSVLEEAKNLEKIL